MEVLGKLMRDTRPDRRPSAGPSSFECFIAVKENLAIESMPVPSFGAARVPPLA
jgi:hypothetical protein